MRLFESEQVNSQWDGAHWNMELIVTFTMEVIVTCLKPLIYVTKKNSILDVVEFLDSSLITFVQDIKDSKDEYE